MAKSTKKKVKRISAKTSKGKTVRFEILADAAEIADDCVARFESAYRSARGSIGLPAPFDPVFKNNRTKKLWRRMLFRSTDRRLQGGIAIWPIDVITETVAMHGDAGWKLVKSEGSSRKIDMEQLLESLETVKQKRCPPDARGKVKIFGFVCDF